MIAVLSCDYGDFGGTIAKHAKITEHLETSIMQT